MISAASFATSTAPATEMPTSAACSDGASLMPSPRKPTTCPRRFSARMIRFFCAGETRAKTVARSATRPSARVAHAARFRRPSDDAAAVEADLAADVPGDQLVVAGEDLHLDPVAAQRARAPRPRPPARVDERRNPASVSSRSSAARVGRAAGTDRGRPRPARGTLAAQRADRSLAARSASPRRAADAARRSPYASQHGRTLSGAPFVIEQMRSVRLLDDDRQPPPLEVERHLVELRVAVGCRRPRARGSRRPAGS